jgi:uridine phosphorylase
MDFGKEAMFHIGLRREQGAGYALLTGDPGRVEGIARLLDEPEFVAQNREYTTWAGRLGGRRLLVSSHGIGGPSTAICVEELFRCGVRTFIRVGTCGGMQREVIGGDLVVASAAIRQEGTGLEYLPVEFPAAAHWRVTAALAEAAAQEGRPVHVGVVHCKDSFYGQHDPAASPSGPLLQYRWQAWLRGGCLASEMESSALFLVSASLGARAGCILTAIWNQEREAAGLSNPRCEDNGPAVRAALAALRRLMAEDTPA